MLEKENPKRSSRGASYSCKNKMQNTFSPSTKGDKTLPGRSLFLCEQQKHKLLFTSHLLPPPPGGFAAVYPKSMKFKKIKFSRLIFLLSWLPPLDFLEPIRCISGVLASFTGQESIYLDFHAAVLTQNPGVILHFHHYFNRDLYIFFFLQGVSDLIPRWAQRSRTSEASSSNGFLRIHRTLNAPSN